MKNYVLFFFFILNLLAQMNPAISASEWSLAAANESAGQVLSKACCDDNSSETDNHSGTTDHHCQCPCHLNFLTPLAPQANLPAYRFVPSSDYIQPNLPGFTGDILRPPRAS